MQQLALLKTPDHIRHGFFGRQGGVSTGLFGSLNCGLASGDDRAAILENRRRVASNFDIPVENLRVNFQIHSPDCVYVEGPLPANTECRADAMVTDKPDLMLGVLSADCAPVLFYGAKANGDPIIGAAHAGWGGTLKGVLESTVRVMCDHGAVPSTIHAGVGPCIGARSYEVSNGFEQPFLDHAADSERFFKSAGVPGKLLFDLPGYIAARLAACGVSRVALADIDTVTHEADYFSYRRATKRAEPSYGRQISVIVLRN